MKSDLTVRLRTTRGDRHVTADLTDLTFRESDLGGWEYVKFGLHRPLILAPDELAHYADVIVHDARTAKVVSQGRVEDLGRTAGPDGTLYDVTAMGPAVHLGDRTVALIYVDRRLDPWRVGDPTESKTYIGVDIGSDEVAGPRIRMQVPTGATWVQGDAGLAVYSGIRDTGQVLARAAMSWDSGFTTANNEMRLGTSLGAGATTAVETDTMGSSSGTLAGSRGGGNAITAGHDTVRLRSVRAAGGNLAGADNVWAQFTSIVIRALLKDAAGTDITTGYTLNTVLASDVVKDLLGRILIKYDGAAATVSTTSFAIEQLAYPDGVTAGKLLEDLLLLEPGFRYGAYEANRAGKHRFEFIARPTAVRYEADVYDGWTSPESATDIYNAVTVRYKTPDGRIVPVRRTSTVPALDAQGLVREFFMDLGDEIGSQTAAERAGDQFLTEHAYPPNAGRLTVARDILDIATGAMVRPYQIKAGELIRIRGVQPRPDALNVNGRNGVTVMNIAAKEYDWASGAATLEVGAYPWSVSRALAQLQQARVARRR